MALIKDLNKRSSKSNAVLSLCLFGLYKSTRHTSCPIRSYRSAPQDEGYFSLASWWTKPGSVWEITAQDATWKPFISVKTRGFLRPCSHPGQPPPSFTSVAPSTCGSLFKAPHQGLWRPQTGGRELSRTGKRICALALASVCERTEGKGKTASLFRGIWLDKLKPSTKRLFCWEPCCPVESVSTQQIPVR